MSRREFQTISSQQVVLRSGLIVREDSVREQQGGDLFNRTVVQYRPAAAVVAMTPSSEVVLINHYRHPIGKYIWEIPGGSIDAGESPQQCAHRELSEESGYNVATLEHLVTFCPEPAFTNHQITIFLGSPAHKLDLVEREIEIDAVRLFRLKEALAMIRSGDIISSWSIVGILLAHQAESGKLEMRV